MKSLAATNCPVAWNDSGRTAHATGLQLCVHDHTIQQAGIASEMRWSIADDVSIAPDTMMCLVELSIAVSV